MDGFEKIEALQKGIENTAPWMVGEQLKEMIRTGTDADGALLAADLEQKGMGLADAEKKIAAYARAHKEGNCGVCPPWEAERILREFYGDFEKQLEGAAEGPRMPVEPTVSEEICPVCGKNLVERDGKFGPFLACPGYPECSFTMPLVEVMPGRCPKCGGRLMKRTGTSKKTNKQYTYYCCEYVNSRDETNKCDFMTWDVPVKDDCPVCGHTMFKRAGKGFKRPYCINEACSNFLPEEKRGYPKKPAEKTEEEAASETAAEEKPAKKTAKTASKKTAATKKTTTKAAEKKPAAKKTTAKKTAEKKSAAKKTTKKTEE